MRKHIKRVMDRQTCGRLDNALNQTHRVEQCGVTNLSHQESGGIQWLQNLRGSRGSPWATQTSLWKARRAMGHHLASQRFDRQHIKSNMQSRMMWGDAV